MLSCWMTCDARSLEVRLVFRLVDAAPSSVISVEAEDVDSCGDSVGSVSAGGVGVSGCGCVSVAADDEFPKRMLSTMFCGSVT